MLEMEQLVANGTRSNGSLRAERIPSREQKRDETASLMLNSLCVVDGIKLGGIPNG